MAGKNSVFVDNSPPAVDAGWLNIIQTENSNIIEDTGQTLNDAILDQESIAMASYAAQGSVFATDSGAADAYVLTQISPFKAPHALKNGLTVKFRAGNNNTGSSTINAFGTGAVLCKQENGSSNLTGGEISTLVDSEFRYNGTNWVLVRHVANVNCRVARITSDQSITAATQTKVQLNGEDYDVGGFFDSATNYRYTPPAGKYQINAGLSVQSTGTDYDAELNFRINGSPTSGQTYVNVSADANVVLSHSDVVNLNGTDYVEIFGSISAGTSPLFLATPRTFFSAFKIS